MPQFPLAPVPGGWIRLDTITHLTTVDTDPDYVEVFFLGGHRECYHRADIPQVLAWFRRQAEQFARGQRIPPPTYAVSCRTMGEDGTPVQVSALFHATTEEG